MAAFSPRRGYWWFPPPLVALLLILPIPTVTQLTFGNAPVTTLSPTSTTLLSAPSDTSQYQSHSPTNSSSSAVTDDSDDSSNDLPPDSVVNYYFLLLGLLVLVLLALLWTFHRRRKRKIARSRHGGHDALARDLEGWRGNRRWAAGGGGRGWRNVFGGHGQRREGRGEDEGGEEAPPPYDDVAEEEARPAHVMLGRGRSGESGRPERTLGSGRNRAVGTSIPLRVLDENAGGEEGKPPEYG